MAAAVVFARALVFAGFCGGGFCDVHFCRGGFAVVAFAAAVCAVLFFWRRRFLFWWLFLR